MAGDAAAASADDWGSEGDDFGDFNDAAEGADDDGFGAFNEAGQQSSAEAPEAAASLPAAGVQQQQQQESQSAAGMGVIWHMHNGSSTDRTLQKINKSFHAHLFATFLQPVCRLPTNRIVASGITQS